MNYINNSWLVMYTQVDSWIYNYYGKNDEDG